MLFLASETTDTKFRRSTGVTTANSTNKDPKANKLSWAINYTTPWGENIAIDTPILRVNASDADITYSVSDDHFSVDSSGVISSNKRLDADSNDGYYEFRVTMTVPVRIYTKNTNDEEPRFSQQVYTAAVDGNAGPNTLVTSVLAHDKVNNSPSSSS